MFPSNVYLQHAAFCPHRDPHQPPSHVTSAPSTKRITFYKSGDSQFGGVKMAVHRRSFKCFEALLDDLSQKVPLPFGVRTVTTPRGTHGIHRLDQLQDGACYLCSDHRRAKPVDMGLAGRRPAVWHPHHHHRHTPQAQRPDGAPSRQRRVLLVKNSEPGRRRSVVLGHRSARSLRAFLEEASDTLQFHVRRLYTAEGRKIDSVQSLMTCPGLLVCVGREPFSPLLVDFLRKSSEERLPGLGLRSPALGPRTPGNGARSPATQGVRSPLHGARSRGSEYSEGRDSRKNVNFGLETKKSIIHPRSDSSTRSTRFSLSSEKSYTNGLTSCPHSHPRPAIMNDDIEKRVMVNKDGSLSVEMKVRFRLHTEDTLQWSTQIKKSPSLTNDCCASREGPPCFLQQGLSKTCSNPDSGSCDPEATNMYPNASLEHPLEANCPCCHQTREQLYDLWENPAHSNKHAPKPPIDGSRPTHARVRQIHSSSSSSSCHSRRVVCQRSRLSSSHGGSGLEQARVEVQEELCVMEEVCTVSRCCSSSGAARGDAGSSQPHSSQSTKDDWCDRDDLELTLSDGDDDRPPSLVSNSSHVLQVLQENQDEEDEELPPSVSQCCQCERSPTPAPLMLQKGEDGGSRASSCHCGGVTPHSLAQEGGNDRAVSSMSKTSKLSCRSSKSKTPCQNYTNDRQEDVQDSIMRSLSSNNGLPGYDVRSNQSSACSHCGGSKGTTTTSDPRHPDQGENHGGSGDERAPSQMSESSREGSGESLHSNKSNLTHHDCTSVMSNIPEERGEGAISKAADSQERAVSVESSKSHKSDVEDRRCPSARSAKSNMCSRSCSSHNSMKKADESVDSASSGQLPTSHHNGTAEGAYEGVSERAASPLSAKSEYSAKSRISHGSLTSTGFAQQIDSTPDDGGNEEAEEEEMETVRPISALSVVSGKSGVSAKSTKSQCSHCSKVATPDPEEAEDAEEQANREENGERAVSALSTRSHLSVKSSKSIIRSSTRASDRSPSPKPVDVENESERASSAVCAKSVKSFASVSKKPAKSCKPHSNNCSRTHTPCSQVEVKAEGMEDGAAEENGARSESVMSSKSAKSAKSAQSSQLERSICAQAQIDEVGAAVTNNSNRAAHRAASAMSVKSATSIRSSNLLKSNSDGDTDAAIKTELETEACDGAEAEEGNDERVGSALSVRSACSSRCHKSICAIHLTAESPAGVTTDNVADRSPSAASVTSGKSTKSHESSSRIVLKAAVFADIFTNRVENPNEKWLEDEDKQPAENGLMPVGDDEMVGKAMSAVSRFSERSGRSKCLTLKCRKCAKAITTCNKTPDIVNVKTPEGDNEESNNRSASAISATKESLCNAAADLPSIAVADDQEDQIEQCPASTKSSKTGSTVMANHVANCGEGRSNGVLSGLTKSARSPSPFTTPTPRSPTMSVRSKASTQSRCHCGAASRTQKREEENNRVEGGEEGETTEDKEPSEQAPSVHSTNSKRQRINSGDTEELLSRDSFGSVSLVLPEEEQGDSDGGESHISSHTNPANATNAERMDESAVKHTVDLEDMANPLPPIQSQPDITIDTPGQSVHSEKDEEPATDMSPTAHSSRSNLSVKGTKPKESERVKTHHLEPSVKRSTSAMSAASGNARSKTPSRANEAHSKDDNKPCVISRTPSRLRTNSAASTCSNAKAKATTAKSNLSSSTPGQKGSKTSDVCSVKSRSSARSKEGSFQPTAQMMKSDDDALCRSSSAADLLREALASARLVSRQSRGSDKSRSTKPGCQINRTQEEEEEGGELTPALLPNASPNEVVSDWLRSIPTDGCLSVDREEMGDGGGEEEEEENSTQEKESPEDQKVNEVAETPEKGVEVEEEEDEKMQGDEEAEQDKEEVSDSGLTHAVDEVTSSDHKAMFQHSVSMSRNCNSSVAVMKVLLSPSLGRSNSLPEVSPVYGRKLSTSAKGLLDCLAQLQLIQPLVPDPACEVHKDHRERYNEVMSILQSLWLTEPRDLPKDQITPSRSSSGVEVGSGSGESGKDNNVGGRGAEGLSKDAAESVLGEEEADAGEGEHDAEGEGTVGTPTPRETSPRPEAEAAESPSSSRDDGPEDAATDPTPPSSSDKSSSAVGGSKSPTDNEHETAAESSGSGTQRTAPPPVLAERATAADPDPTWALHLLRKLEKQFMSHYMAAMVEFKARWDLEDNVLLDTMIAELRDEVGRRIQSSVGRELKKIQGRAGRGGRTPRPPVGTLSRESTMTERRRQMLKVMKNQPKTADSLSDGEKFSDERSDDEYCPCDACVRKKLAARPARTPPTPATPAPLRMDFDLRKILQLRRDPETDALAPRATPSPLQGHPSVGDIDGAGALELEGEDNNLEVVQEEEEEKEEELKMEMATEMVETIPEEEEEEDLEAEEEETGKGEGENEIGAVDDEGDGAWEGNAVQGTGSTGGGEVEEDEQQAGECGGQCQGDVEEEKEEGEEERVEAEEEKVEQEESEEAEKVEEERVEAEEVEEVRDGEEGEEGGEVTTPDEADESGKTSEQQEGDDEEENEEEEEEEICQECMVSHSKPEEEAETTEKKESREGEEEEEASEEVTSDEVVSSGEEPTTVEEEQQLIGVAQEEGDDEGREDSPVEVNTEEEKEGGEEEESARAVTPTVCVTMGEEADGEDLGGETKQPESNDASEAGGANDIGDAEKEEEKEAGAIQRLPQQVTRSSVESQPGSMEDLVSPPPASSTHTGPKPVAAPKPIVAPKPVVAPKPRPPDGVSGGVGVSGRGQRRSRSPARVKRRKQREGNVELDDL
ncbi:unnamed protein product [Gadus morhua 'NCC']